MKFHPVSKDIIHFKWNIKGSNNDIQNCMFQHKHVSIKIVFAKNNKRSINIL